MSLSSPSDMIKSATEEEETKEDSNSASRNTYNNSENGTPCGGMNRHEKERIDRLGKLIKSKRER